MQSLSRLWRRTFSPMSPFHNKKFNLPPYSEVKNSLREKNLRNERWFFSCSKKKWFSFLASWVEHYGIFSSYSSSSSPFFCFIPWCSHPRGIMQSPMVKSKSDTQFWLASQVTGHCKKLKLHFMTPFISRRETKNEVSEDRILVSKSPKLAY